MRAHPEPRDRLHDTSTGGADWAAVRALFPAADTCTYLNTASHGLLPASASAVGEQYYRAMRDDAGAALGSHWSPRLEEARKGVARFVGARASNVAFVPNASAAMNLSAALINEPGEVIAHRDEFPSVTLPFEQRGHPLRLVEPDTDGTVTVMDYANAIGPQTRYIAISAVQYASGYRVDLSGLRELCSERGLYLICDATQAVGSVPIDVRNFAPDVMTFSSYKWACAGYGVAALYVSDALLANKPLPAVGWRSARNPYGLVNHGAEFVRDAYALELGNPVMPGPLVLGASLAVLETIGIEAIAARGLALGERLREGASALGIRVRSPEDPARRASITMLQIPDAPSVEQALRAANVHTSARAGLIRVAPHLYNNEHDIDALLGALETP